MGTKMPVITKDLIAPQNLTDEEDKKIVEIQGRYTEDVLGDGEGWRIFLSMLDALKKAKLQPKTVVA